MIVELGGIRCAVVVGKDTLQITAFNPDFPALVIDARQLAEMLTAYQIGQDLKAGMEKSRKEAGGA